ncbi:MAG: ABC transporter permease [Symbiobacteriaceae bacterium]|nr:MAG: ABC transporter permease [Bacillota bacterium]
MNWTLLIDPSVLALALVVATPVLLAALGELLIERSGVLNVAIEGMMALGAAVGFLGAYLSGSNMVGILAAMAVAALLGLVLGYACITLRAPQLTVGLALFVLAVGLSSLLYRLVVGLQFVPPQIPTYGSGLAADGAGWLFALPGPVYVMLLATVLTHVLLFYTPWGLRIRASGENPRAAESQGVAVFTIRYASLLAGSALIGAGGALLPMMLTGTYTDMMVGGRGWIALMLVILGRWTPFGVLLGGLLFGYVEALQYNLLLKVRLIPSQFLLMVPYLFVVLVAIRAYRGAQAPQALMKPYDRELRA